MRLRFTVPGPPVPKARARVVRGNDGKTRSFTPKKTSGYQEVVRMCALSAWSRFRWNRDDAAARYGLAITIFRSTSRGDWDNYGKSISDACNGVLWVDDRQIRDASVKIEDCERGKERAEVEAWVL